MPTSARGRDPAGEEEFLGALYKGGELLASGKIVEAREHLEKAHGLAPKNEKAQNLLGLAYFKLGLFDQASEVYERLVNENPTDATLRVNLGLVYLKTNNLERCVKEFETATDLEPTHKKAHNYLGLALAQQGSYVKAKEHFELAGSEPMAEKMGRAIAAQSSPSGFHQPVARQAPLSVVIGGEPPPSAPPRAAPAPAPAPPPRVEEETIEVMSDEELPSDVYVVPEEVTVSEPPAADLTSDWGAQLKPPAPAEDVPMRFADDEGPPEASLQPAEPQVEELPVLDAVIEAMPEAEAVQPPPRTETPSWLTTEAGEARTEPHPAETGWVTETVSDVPLTPSEVEGPLDAPLDAPLDVPLGATDARWGESAPAEALAQPETATEWVTQEAPPPEAPAEVSQQWAATEAAPAEQTWDSPPAEAPQPTAGDASWATAEAAPAEPVPTDPSWATAEVPPEAPLPSTADDASWATAEAAPAEAPPSTPDDASWATAEAGPAEALPSTPDDASWATGATEPVPAEDPAAQTQWATDQVQGVEPQPVEHAEEQWVTSSAIEPLPMPEPVSEISAAAPEPALDVPSEPPAPEPSAPINITVEEPQDAPAPVAAPAGYSPMSPQRLVDLGASGNWVHEPSAGPFHISSDGLAVTVSGEMMVRMLGLVAIVGSVQVTPEHRRRRGRPSQEPFGTGPSQLQRVSGHGVLYLEPGKSKFHAVDLTDQNGVAIDDDGAYIREEMVFAFEEAIFFENGRLTAEGQSLELAHLKGNGRVLLQLDGTLRAMPIPLGAPMVVPLHRVVGWFGRVSPRLMGFGGRGAVELTGEGYALLGTPAEGR
jgi:uncharacterized protein (AIM24 family)